MKKQQKSVVEKEPISEVVEVEILEEEKPKAKPDNPKSPEKKRKEKNSAKKEKKEKASPSLYNEFKEEYNQFCLRETGTMADWRNGAAYGKALKGVIEFLEKSVQAKYPDMEQQEAKQSALGAWKWVLSAEKWDFLRKAEPYYCNIDLCRIRTNIQNIINIQINGKGKLTTKEAEIRDAQRTEANMENILSQF